MLEIESSSRVTFGKEVDSIGSQIIEPAIIEAPYVKKPCRWPVQQIRNVVIKIRADREATLAQIVGRKIPLCTIQRLQAKDLIGIPIDKDLIAENPIVPKCESAQIEAGRIDIGVEYGLSL